MANERTSHDGEIEEAMVRKNHGDLHGSHGAME
jgi:hypothetical protein